MLGAASMGHKKKSKGGFGAALDTDDMDVGDGGGGGGGMGPQEERVTPDYVRKLVEEAGASCPSIYTPK